MSYIDLAIPGLIGLLLLLWPQSVFKGSHITPDVKKVRLVRTAGILLVLVAVAYTVIMHVSS